ncbi:MAG: hypothetical protein ACXQTA_04135 [Candidatus Syntropharchaeales archaeon]
MRSGLIEDTEAVSVIIGAMLLIIVVVTAVTALAFIIAGIHEDAAEKAALAAAMDREELDILKITLDDEATIDDFEGVYEVVEGKEGSEIGYRTLNMTPDWDKSANITMKVEQLVDVPNGHALKISGNAGEFIEKTLDENELFEYHPGDELALSLLVHSINPTDNFTVELYKGGSVVASETVSGQHNWDMIAVPTPGFDKMKFKLNADTTGIYLDDISYTNSNYWGECEVTIRNTNIDPCTLKEIAIQVGEATLFVRDYSIFFKEGNKWIKQTFTPHYPYEIPPQQTVPVKINFLKSFGEPREVQRGYPHSLGAIAITGFGNNFARSFAPPVPVAHVNIASEDIGVTYRDVLILDATDSYDPDGYIVEYNWSVFYNDSGTYREHNQLGRVVTANITNLRGIGVDPIKIDLKVTDDTGMATMLSQISGNITIPSSRNFNPPTKLYTNKTEYEEGDKIYVWANDSWNNPVEGVFVKFTPSCNVTLSSLSGVTNATVTVQTVGTNGTVCIESGKLIPIYVNVVKS